MLISLIISVLLGGTQPADYRFIASVEAAGRIHRTDPIGNVYIANGNNLKKFDGEQRPAADYTNSNLGDIFSVDVSDPLRILLYFKDHNQIVWVDNYLREIRSPVFLDAIGIDQAKLVCSSSQGGFWVLNGLNNRIRYYDARLQFVYESISLNALTGPDINPSQMIEKNRQLYLNIPGTGILVFDLFGNYLKTLVVDAPSEFQVTERYLYYFKEGQLYSYHLITAEVIPVELPDSRDVLYAELQPGFMYLFTERGFRVYSLQ